MTLTLLQELRGDAFNEFFRALLDHAQRIGLVWQGGKVSDRTARLFDRLSPYALYDDLVTEWPGSSSPSEWNDMDSVWAEVRVYRYEEPVARIVCEECSDLYEWVNPTLPQDLHLLDAQGHVIFGSITTESDSWLELTSAEWHKLVSARPGLSALAVREDVERGAAE